MSLKELEEGVRALDTASRHRLMALMVAIEDGGDEGYRRELAARIDDSNPANWISWEDARKQLAEDE